LRIEALAHHFEFSKVDLIEVDLKEDEWKWVDQKGGKQSCGRIGNEDAIKQSREIRPVTKRSVIM